MYDNIYFCGRLYKGRLSKLLVLDAMFIPHHFIFYFFSLYIYLFIF